MTFVRDIVSFAEKLAPLELTEPWDNVGLLAGRMNAQVGAMLISLDITAEVIEEAVLEEAQLIFSHHPLLIDPIKKVTDEDETGRLILRLIENQVAAVCMHTNLDAAEGGINDVLAHAMALRDIAPLGAGASGKIGRVGNMRRTMELATFMEYAKEMLGCPGIRYCDAGRPVNRVAVGGGSCGAYMDLAIAAGCDTFVTADVKYHEMRKAAALSLNLIDAGHFETENLICLQLLKAFRQNFPDIAVMKSRANQGIIRYM